MKLRPALVGAINDGDKGEILKEAADVALCVMMAADCAGALQYPASEEGRGR